MRQCSLEGAVGPGSKINFSAGHRSNGNDRRGLAFFQIWHRCVDKPDRTQHVDVETLSPALFVIADRQRTDIANDNIQTTEIDTSSTSPTYPTNVVRRKDLVLMRQPHHYLPLVMSSVAI